jgi:hypothetical protein
MGYHDAGHISGRNMAAREAKFKSSVGFYYYLRTNHCILQNGRGPE